MPETRCRQIPNLPYLTRKCGESTVLVFYLEYTETGLPIVHGVTKAAGTRSNKALAQ